MTGDREGAARGYGGGQVDTVISVDEVVRQTEAIAEEISVEQLDGLVAGEPYVALNDLVAGYGQMHILHGINLRVGRKQSLCLIGPNGAGKSTVLHAIFGFNNIFSGSIVIGQGDTQRDVTSLTPSEKLGKAGIAYILQDKSIFPGMTVEENLWMGGFLKNQPAEARAAAESVFDKYPRLAARRRHQAKVLSGGERRLLEISRALVMNPELLLVDEPAAGMTPEEREHTTDLLLEAAKTRAVVVVEHDMEFVRRLNCKVTVLHEGSVLAEGSLDHVTANQEVIDVYLGR